MLPVLVVVIGWAKNGGIYGCVELVKGSNFIKQVACMKILGLSLSWVKGVLGAIW